MITAKAAPIVIVLFCAQAVLNVTGYSPQEKQIEQVQK
jgi:hypothetical protein